MKTCLYADVCKLGAQVEKLFNIFPRQQVYVVMFDDFVRDTQSCYKKILDFLKVPYDGQKYFPPLNVRRSFKSRKLAWMSWKFRDMGAYIKQRMGIVRAFNVLDFLHRLNEKSESRPTLSPQFRNRLIEEFQTDIEKLSNLIERDLSDWLN